MQIGKKIKLLRLQNQLTQEELANRCELSKGFISQIERDLTSPSIATLMDILECLGVSINEFFSETAKKKVVYTEKDFSIQSSAASSIIWLIPAAQKNLMEPIVITLNPESSTPVDYPHDGEEFGYIMSGKVVLHIGESTYKCKKGEAFYFNANIPHFIENAGKVAATLIWVSSPPNF